MTLTKLRNQAVMIAVVTVLALVALQAYGDGDGGDPNDDNKIKVVLKIFVDVPSGHKTPYARGDVLGNAGHHGIDWKDIKMPPVPAAVRAAFLVDHGAALGASVRIVSGAVDAVFCRWYLDDANAGQGFEGTGLTTGKVDTANSVWATCSGTAP